MNIRIMYRELYTKRIRTWAVPGEDGWYKVEPPNITKTKETTSIEKDLPGFWTLKEALCSFAWRPCTTRWRKSLTRALAPERKRAGHVWVSFANGRWSYERRSRNYRTCSSFPSSTHTEWNVIERHGDNQEPRQVRT